MNDRMQSTVELETAMQAIRARVGHPRVDVAIVFGSGLSDACRSAHFDHSIAYVEIPGLAAPSVIGHPGNLSFGEWAGQGVAVFQGRMHYYEGYPWSRVSLPVRIAAMLGAKVLFVTNSSGGVNASLSPGQLVCIDDHINLIGANPLVGMGPNHEGNLFTDMSAAYCPQLRRQLDAAAETAQLNLAHGVYLAVSGPNYETPAEIRAFRALGADMVGMSTVGEVLVARHLGLRCVGVSCVSNHAAGVVEGEIDHAHVLAAGKKVAAQLGDLLGAFLQRLNVD